MACLRGVSGVLTTRKWRAYYPILIFSTLRRRYAKAEKVVKYFYKTRVLPGLFSMLLPERLCVLTGIHSMKHVCRSDGFFVAGGA